MSVTKNKSEQKSNKKQKIFENSTVSSLQNGQSLILQSKRKRTCINNIDWEQVLNFDILAIKDQVYEVPWMSTTQKRKRIFHSSDKSQGNVTIQNNVNNYSDTEKNGQPSKIKLNSNNINMKQKIEANNSGRSNGQKIQKNSIINELSSNITLNQQKPLSSSSQKSGLKTKTDSNMEQEISVFKIDESIKRTRLQSLKERSIMISPDKNIKQSDKQNQNLTPVKNINAKQCDNSKISSQNNSPIQEDKILIPSRALTRQEGKKLLKNNAEMPEFQSIIQSPQRNQNSTKITQIIDQEPSLKKDTIQEDLSDNLQLAQKKRQTIKRSPNSSRLNEETIGINQPYDDSDASTRDEDHLDAQNKVMKSTQVIHNTVLSRVRTRGGEMLNKKNIELEKKKIENVKEEEDKSNQNQINEKDYSLIKIKQFKNKSTSEEAGEDNQISYKEGNNNQKNNLINKKLIKNKPKIIDQIELSNKKSLSINSDQNISDQTELELKLASNESLSSCQSKTSLKSEKGIKSPQNKYLKSSSNKNTRHKGKQYKKSFFSKLQSKESNDDIEEEKDKPLAVSSSSLPSDQNFDKIEDDMNIDDSVFENSNNNIPILQEQQSLQAVDEQQQVPHLYIRNQAQAIKVGRKYQAIIPEISTYKETEHLERLITEQKVWGSDWMENKEINIEKYTATLKQWYGHRRNSEQCLHHLLMMGFDSSQYNKFLEENQDFLYSFYNQMDAKYLKKKPKKRILYSYK